VSHIVPVLIIAFIIWQWLARARRQGGGERQEPSSLFEQLSERGFEALSERREGRDLEDVAGEIAGLFAAQGQEALARTVGRVLDNPEVERKLEEVLQPIVTPPAVARIDRKKKQKLAAQQRHADRAPRIRYLLDGEDGYRQKVDRTARLQQAMRGRGLCSPR
jgi:hypothetical protein